MELMTITHVQAPHDRDTITFKTRRAKGVNRSIHQRREIFIDALHVPRNEEMVRFSVLVNHIRADQTGCPVHGSRQRNDYLLDAQLSRISSCMHGRRATESKKSKLPRVISSFHSGFPD